LHQLSRGKKSSAAINFPLERGSTDPVVSSIVGRQVAIDHEREWRNSGVDPMLIRLNVQTLTAAQVDPYSREMQYPIAERLNWRVNRWSQSKALRGWWVSGVDPLNHWQPMTWGRFKPDADTPVFDKTKGKAAKYLSPSFGKGSSRLVLLDVPFRIWQLVAAKYGLEISRQDVQQGFWHWVWQLNVPIVLTEGEKKAGCLLSHGYAAISLPGIFGGYRRDGNQLIPELAFFATPGRQFQICFDYETKPQVAHNIFLATCRLGQLLTRSGGTVKVLTLPGPQKGVDDLIVDAGVGAFNQVVATAQDWSFWQTTKLWSLTYPAQVELSQPYLDNLDYPESGLAFVKSPKGTGKTTALKGLVKQAIDNDRKVLVITHRIQLGRAICRSIGIDWIDAFKARATEFTTDSPDLDSFGHGFGLCIDSLHPNSQAKFDPSMWDGALVILDEVEQVLWHGLNSDTCYNARVRILETLRELVQHVLQTGGLIVAQDADLSDVSIHYLKQLADQSIGAADFNLSVSVIEQQSWLALNRYIPPTQPPVHLYDTKTPAALIAQLPNLLAKGAVFIALDSQRVQGRWSSKNLETYLQNHFPEKRILRIDSETVANVDHAAFGIAYRINEVVAQYDIVLATPTIGTGVSIDVKGHFGNVLGIFQGAISDTEARQALARVREPLPCHVWAARYGPGKIGNGSCFYQDLVRSTAKAVKYNIMLLREVDFDIDQYTDPIALRTWSKMAARVNLSLWQFRDAFKNGLLREGRSVSVTTDDDLNAAIIEEIQQTITEVRSRNQQAAADAIVDASAEELEEAIAATKVTTLEKRSKTPHDKNRQRKRELQYRYSVQVTSELAMKDERGWYQQLLLHYYVTHDPLFVKLRDMQEWQTHLERGAGKVALQDVQLFTAQVEMLKVMQVLTLLDPDRKTRATDELIQRIAKLGWDYRQDIRTLFNIRITQKTPPMTFVQGLLAKMDVKLIAVSRDRMADGRRGGQRVYRYDAPTDDRSAIFAQWLERDEALVAVAQAAQRKHLCLLQTA
jgi:hypothetical protein